MSPQDSAPWWPAGRGQQNPSEDPSTHIDTPQPELCSHHTSGWKETLSRVLCSQAPWPLHESSSGKGKTAKCMDRLAVARRRRRDHTIMELRVNSLCWRVPTMHLSASLSPKPGDTQHSLELTEDWIWGKCIHRYTVASMHYGGV